MSRRSAIIARQPIGRLGTPEEIAALAEFLANPNAGFITGQALAIDGGGTDMSRQVNDLEDLFAQGVQGLLIFPKDSVLVGEPIANLYNERKLPVLVTDIGARKGEIAFLVITDNLAGGHLAAERMAALLPDGGKVIFLDFAHTNDKAQLRQQGFEDRGRIGPGRSSRSGPSASDDA